MKKTRNMKCRKRQERGVSQEDVNGQLYLIPMRDKETTVWSGEMGATGHSDWLGQSNGVKQVHCLSGTGNKVEEMETVRTPLFIKMCEFSPETRVYSMTS